MAVSTFLFELTAFTMLASSLAYRISPAERTYSKFNYPKSQSAVGNGNRGSSAEKTISGTYCFVPPVPVDLPAGSLDAVLASAEANITRAWKSAGNVPGSLSVNLIYDQNIIWSKTYGKKNSSDPESGLPDGNTAYRIGSISKVFTTLLALFYRDQGLWHLDDVVEKYIPHFSVVNPFRTRRGITLRQLASHMGGLSREAPCAGTYDNGCHDSDAEILSRLAKMPLVQQPGWRPSYSNLGFSLLGLAEAYLTGDPWVEMTTELASSLFMNNTHAAVPDRPAENIAEGYMPDGSQAEWVDIGFEAPAGQMFSSANDLAELIKLVFRSSEPYDEPRGQILDGETLREWMHPVYMAEDLSGFGLVWELFQGGSYNFRSKDGAINGYRSFMLFAPEIKVGAVVLLSNEDSQILNEVAKNLILSILGISDVLEKHQPLPSLPPKPSEYVGVYAHSSSNPDLKASVNISLQAYADGHQELVLSGIGMGGVLQWRHADVFQLTNRYSPHFCGTDTDGETNFYVNFWRDAANKVITASAPGFIYDYVVTKQP